MTTIHHRLGQRNESSRIIKNDIRCRVISQLNDTRTYGIAVDRSERVPTILLLLALCEVLNDTLKIPIVTLDNHPY